MAARRERNGGDGPSDGRPRRDDGLEIAIGRQVRAFRTQYDMTIAELAKRAGLSPGMLSKIERGNTSSSLATLTALSRALNIPVTSLFRQFEEEREVAFVKAGTGLVIERRGTRAGHQYELLGHSVGNRYLVEPYMISITEASDVFPLFQHAGVEFIYMLEGDVDYKHADKVYRLTRGDSLFFDAEAPHGPEQLVSLPIRFLSVIVQSPQKD